MTLISIITATYNSAATLPRLISSFRRAKIEGVEWIVVDGASQDGTVELLKQASDIVDVFISEPDSGIYGAWNKGLNLAKGKYVAFIGADDFISDQYFVEVISAIDNEHNIIGVHIQFINNERVEKSIHTTCWRTPWNYPVNLGFSHPGTLHASSLFNNGLFDTGYKIAGDRELLTRNAQLLRPKIHITKEPLLFFQLGGVSSDRKNILLSYKEILRLLYFSKQKTLAFYPEMLWISLKYLCTRLGLRKRVF